MSPPIRTLLVVDDDTEFRENLTNIFTAQGYAVLTAANGARALDVLAHVPTRCLVVTDLSMPLMSGDEFVIELQKLEQAGTRFPVIVLSGSDISDAWRLPGVVRTFAKPLKLPELLAAVREECEAFSTTPDETLRLDREALPPDGS